jgi:hypothetical protein
MVVSMPVRNHNRFDRFRADAMHKRDDAPPGTRRSARVNQDQSVGLLNYGKLPITST